MKRLLLVFGTRPDAIKMCPLVQELRRRESFSVSVCVTGQHREMLQEVLDFFGVVPEYNLDIMRPEQSLFALTAAVLTQLELVLQKECPDWLFCHGDTTTALAAALAAYYNKIPVGHVEAGLRTCNPYAPFPEEMNRRMVTAVAALHFAPTETAKQNLLREGVDPARIFVTGNTAIDALRATFREDYNSPLLRDAGGRRLIVLTAHRRESFGAPLRSIFRAVGRIVRDFPDVTVLYPVHRNPAVQQAAEAELSGLDRVLLTEPLGLYDFHNILGRAYLILTDSGGIQEEAPSLGVPVLVLREDTERPEGIAAGTLRLAGTTESSVYAETKRLLEDTALYAAMSRTSNPYGDGRASRKIADLMELSDRLFETPIEG